MKIKLFIIITILIKISYGTESKYKCDHTNSWLKNNKKPKPLDDKIPHVYSYLIVVSSYDKSGNITGCGGTMISDERALTAAGCVFKSKADDQIIIATGNIRDVTSYFTLRVNTSASSSIDPSYGVQEIRVKKKHIHPKFKYSKCINDIAMLDMDGKFTKEFKIKPIKMNFGAVDYKCMIFGWTLLHNRQLVSVLDYAEGDPIFQDNRLCILNSVLFDPGTPLVCKEELFGIASYIYEANKNICAIYSALRVYSNWIQTIDEEHKSSATLKILNLYIFWFYLYSQIIAVW